MSFVKLEEQFVRGEELLKQGEKMGREVGLALVSKIIKAWDSDFTKVTPEEKKRLEEIEAEMEAGIYFTEKEVFD